MSCEGLSCHWTRRGGGEARRAGAIQGKPVGRYASTHTPARWTPVHTQDSHVQIQKHSFTRMRAHTRTRLQTQAGVTWPPNFPGTAQMNQACCTNLLTELTQALGGQVWEKDAVMSSHSPGRMECRLSVWEGHWAQRPVLHSSKDQVLVGF